MRNLFCTILLFFTSVSLVFTSPAHPLSSSSTPFASSVLEQGNFSLGASPADCNEAKYGGNLLLQSSLNALAKLSQDPTSTTFEMREPGEELGWNVILPHRIISDDGKVFIDVATKDNAIVSDTSAWREIRDAANSIIQTCVSQPIAKGGMIDDIGVEGLLTVTVSSYDNSNVQCFNPSAQAPYIPPQYDSCKSVLDIMDWGTSRPTFGDAPSPIGVPVILLPKYIFSTDRRCALRIGVLPGYDFASWESLWAAAVAAQEMCVKQGQAGFVDGLGTMHKMYIAFFEPRVGAVGSDRLNLTLSTAGTNLTLYQE